MQLYDAHKVMAKASGIQVGDKVKILRKARNNEMGWLYCWSEEMDTLIDTIHIVTEITKDGLYRISNRFNLPFFILEIVEKHDPAKGLKPFDKVLVRDSDEQFWRIEFFSHYKSTSRCPFLCLNGGYVYCIPYEGNEYLLGNANMPT